MDSPSRRRTYDFPKPEAGLAEWTNRIKELQREVDADEEAEQRKLEEEIRASRLARSRRSGGIQHAGKVDIERSGSPAGFGARRSESPSSPGLSTLENRQKNQSDALRKLTGEAAPPPTAKKPSSTPSASSLSESMPRTKAEPMSLAAFMGGRATGPRLNRPAPQADAHDPTLFEQRTRADITAPHPLFGTGGVALAGLASKGREIIGRSDTYSSLTPAPSLAKERTASTPQVVKSIERQPSPVTVVGQSGIGVRGRVESLYGNKTIDKPSTPPLCSTKSIEKLTPATPVKPEGLRRPLSTQEPARRISPSPSQSSQTASSSPKVVSGSSSSSPSATVPSLARPIQPQPRSPPNIIPTTKNPSPAFLKPPQQKDLTPSLSRLQGRGFVQSLVKLSSELEAQSSSTNTTPERSVTPKRSTVFDRWQPQNTGGQTPSPVSAPPVRKAKTIDGQQPPRPPSASGDRSEQKRPAPPQKSHSVADEVKTHTTGPKRIVPQDTGGLGSSNTLLSFIKPNKTGENPPTDQLERPKSSAGEPINATNSFGHDVDELGVRPRTKSNPSSVAAAKAIFSAAQSTQAAERSKTKSELASIPSGRSLSHPTKDRARLRRKGAGGHPRQSSEREPTHDNLSAELTETLTVENANPPQKTFESPKSSPFTAPSTSTSVNTPSITPSKQSAARGDNIRRLQDTWTNQGPIGVKPLRKPSPQPLDPSPASNAPSRTNNNANKRALPGLANVNTVVSPPSPPLTPPLSAKQENPPSSPVRSRIPSTGSRPTVMDVAQAFNKEPSPTTEPSKSAVVTRIPRSPVVSEYNAEDPGGWGQVELTERTITPAVIKAERRRSNYEKYSNFTLPVLPEEKTPAPSPAGTLTKADAAAIGVTPSAVLDILSGGQEVAITEQRVEAPKEPQQLPSKVHIDIVDEPIPPVNVSKHWSSGPPTFKPDPDMRTVSVEVLGVEGGVTSEIQKGPDNIYIFHDEEVYAIVHRAKSRSSGLVATKVWCWSGKKAEVGNVEDKKLQELAKRYGSNLLTCSQCGEPQELLHILGGSLILRQGKRTLWSDENTTMHRARSWFGLTLIDEVDLSVKHLCSGFSYCICVLDTLWVWYGCGSTQVERDAAKRYSQHLGSGKNVVELEEGQEDETFWMFLGDDGYASADYWKWKKQSPMIEKHIDPRMWKIAVANMDNQIYELESFPSATVISNAIVVLHLVYEVFVLIGSLARGSRRDISLALTFAQGLSQHTSRSKPFRPPVHILILPSRIPLDLCAAVRGLEEEALNADGVPDHMNLLNLEEAWQQLRKREWNQEELEDTRMMPLGLAPMPAT